MSRILSTMSSLRLRMPPYRMLGEPSSKKSGTAAQSAEQAGGLFGVGPGRGVGGRPFRIRALSARAGSSAASCSAVSTVVPETEALRFSAESNGIDRGRPQGPCPGKPCYRPGETIVTKSSPSGVSHLGGAG